MESPFLIISIADSLLGRVLIDMDQGQTEVIHLDVQRLAYSR